MPVVQIAASASHPIAGAIEPATTGAAVVGTIASPWPTSSWRRYAIRSDSDHGIAGPHGRTNFTITTSQIAADHAGRSLPARTSKNASSASTVPCAHIMASIATAPFAAAPAARRLTSCLP